jgi:hypothetical protein
MLIWDSFLLDQYAHVLTYLINSADPGPTSHQESDDLQSVLVARVVERSLSILVGQETMTE